MKYSKCNIEVEMDNAAFNGPNQFYELADILEHVVRQLRRGDVHQERSLFDMNGNNVGGVTFREDGEDAIRSGADVEYYRETGVV
jgi:hypothetical protein